MKDEWNTGLNDNIDLNDILGYNKTPDPEPRREPSWFEKFLAYFMTVGGVLFYIFFVICWCFGGIAGVITAVIHHSIGHALGSMFVPMWGAIYTIYHLVT